MVLAISNVVTTALGELYDTFAQAWVIYNSLSIVELSANIVLLFSMTPPIIMNLFRRIIGICYKPKQREEETSTLSLDQSYTYDIETESIDEYNLDSEDQNSQYYQIDDRNPSDVP